MSLDLCLVISSDTFDEKYEEVVFDMNITHNLVSMLKEANLYDVLYAREGYTANDIRTVLYMGFTYMIYNPTKFKKLNPANGWGDYDGLMTVLKNLLIACAEYPKAIIHISK